MRKPKIRESNEPVPRHTAGPWKEEGTPLSAVMPVTLRAPCLSRTRFEEVMQRQENETLRKPAPEHFSRAIATLPWSLAHVSNFLRS